MIYLLKKTINIPQVPEIKESVWTNLKSVETFVETCFIHLQCRVFYAGNKLRDKSYLNRTEIYCLILLWSHNSKTSSSGKYIWNIRVFRSTYRNSFHAYFLWKLLFIGGADNSRRYKTAISIALYKALRFLKEVFSPIAKGTIDTSLWHVNICKETRLLPYFYFRYFFVKGSRMSFRNEFFFYNQWKLFPFFICIFATQESTYVGYRSKNWRTLTILS